MQASPHTHTHTPDVQAQPRSSAKYQQNNGSTATPVCFPSFASRLLCPGLSKRQAAAVYSCCVLLLLFSTLDYTAPQHTSALITADACHLLLVSVRVGSRPGKWAGTPHHHQPPPADRQQPGAARTAHCKQQQWCWQHRWQQQQRCAFTVSVVRHCASVVTGKQREQRGQRDNRQRPSMRSNRGGMMCAGMRCQPLSVAPQR